MWVRPALARELSSNDIYEFISQTHPGDHRIVLAGDAKTVWSMVQAIGGINGWYFAHSLWWLRGIMGSLAGGPGLLWGPCYPTDLRMGDRLDFWRVIAVEPPHRLLLAEMKTPGEALLEFVIIPEGQGKVELKMVSRFCPGAWPAFSTGTPCCLPTSGFLKAC